MHFLRTSKWHIWLLITAFTLFNSCDSIKPYYQKTEKEWASRQLPTEPPSYSVFLIGDAGEPTSAPLEPALQLLKNQLQAADSAKSAVIFLGDNIYPKGMHKKKHELRPQDEERINSQLMAVQDFKGKIFFIPGNHDWQKGGKDGWKQLKREEKYIQQYLDRGDTFIPDDGCPGPEKEKLTNDLVLLAIDTQWWLHRHERPEGEQDGCNVSNEAEFLLQLEDEIKSNKEKHILVVGHHPMFSRGYHGGYFPLKEHLFPLTHVNKNLYLPLPGLGSIHPFYRKYVGHSQDLTSPVNRSMQQSLTSVFQKYPTLIYANGHEHNLQYFEEEGIDYLTSGSGSKHTYLQRGGTMKFGQNTEGFSVVHYYPNGQVWTEFWVPEGNGNTGRVVFRKQLKEAGSVQSSVAQEAEKKSYAGQTVTLAAEPGYEASGLKEALLGTLNRQAWTTPIEVPVLDIHYEKGGLTPIKKGGGMQTLSLRLEGKDGHQYVLRTIQKFTKGLLPKPLQETFAASIVQDGVAASHPYGALAVPPLAHAVGVFHTQPRLVIVPDDPILGQYRSEFAGKLCLFEERPEGNMTGFDNLGNAEKVVSSADMREKLLEKQQHKVDQQALGRARLLDMLMADWDRHDDQWRWAAFKEGKETLYRPIPRDRDQVFFYQDGLFPSLTNRKWAIRKFQPFNPHIRDIAGQNFNARYVDRSYLTQLNRQDWLGIARSMQAQLTDSVLTVSVQALPASVAATQGPRLLHVLKARRDNLQRFAEEYYYLLAQEVDVVGTLDSDYFEVARLDNEHTEVTVFARKNGQKQADKVLFKRVFLTSETREIRLNGLAGKDEYQLSGNVKRGPLIRIIGGEDDDTITDQSSVRGWSKKTKVYDTEDRGEKTPDNQIVAGPDTRTFLTADKDAVFYNRKDFKYNQLAPLLSLAFNPDDGLYLGTGVNWVRQGFKKQPYKSRVRYAFNVASTGAYNSQLMVDFPQVIGKWGFMADFIIKAPDFLFNFYGIGNETEKLSTDPNDHRLRFNQIEVYPTFYRQLGSYVNLKAGPYWQVAFAGDEQTQVNDLLLQMGISNKFETRNYLGGRFTFLFENKDRPHNPNRGISWLVDGSYNHSVERDREFGKLQSELSVYIPVGIMPTRTTLAIRGGGGVNLGAFRDQDYEVYQANFIGGLSNFRGVRRNRFGGDRSFYQNTDLRLKVFDFYNYVVPIEVGIIGFHDIGRVWATGEDSDKWHKSYGGGIYFSPLNAVTIVGNYGKSDDDEIFNVQFGFLF